MAVKSIWMEQTWTLKSVYVDQEITVRMSRIWTFTKHSVFHTVVVDRAWVCSNLFIWTEDNLCCYFRSNRSVSDRLNHSRREFLEDSTSDSGWNVSSFFLGRNICLRSFPIIRRWRSMLNITPRIRLGLFHQPHSVRHRFCPSRGCTFAWWVHKVFVGLQRLPSSTLTTSPNVLNLLIKFYSVANMVRTIAARVEDRCFRLS